jgi:tRNA(Ile)-lysidine synthase
VSLDLTHWQSKLISYNKIWVAYSGGLDSQVLLDLLIQDVHLKPKIQAIHVNHGLSENADSWTTHCVTYCKKNNIPLTSEQIMLTSLNSNIEEQAREARYAVFQKHIQENECLVLAHHQDDQAETILLQLLRGAGIDGLAAMPMLTSKQGMTIIRPLLDSPKELLKCYAEINDLSFVDDESNNDTRFDRNYLRHEIMPRLKFRWPKASNSLARSAALISKAKSNIDELAILDSGPIIKNNLIIIKKLQLLSRERQLNVLRHWVKINNKRVPNEKKINQIIDNVINAKNDANPEVCFDDIAIMRFNQRLYLVEKTNTIQEPEKIWHLPEELCCQLDNGLVEAIPCEKGLNIPLDAICMIKFRQGGEIIKYRGVNRRLKKLMHELKIPPWQRDKTPLLYVNQELAAVIPYVYADDFYSCAKSCWNLVYHR